MTCRHTRFAYLDMKAEGGWGGLAWLQASFLGKHLLMEPSFPALTVCHSFRDPKGGALPSPTLPGVSGAVEVRPEQNEDALLLKMAPHSRDPAAPWECSRPQAPPHWGC